LFLLYQCRDVDTAALSAPFGITGGLILLGLMLMVGSDTF
jgi:hypothetical protein